MSAQPQTELTGSPPILNLPEFLSPFPGRKPRGKIANLPKVQRDQINVMLLEGATYAVIIQKLAEQGVCLNAENLSNWHQSGYQLWLREQQWLELLQSHTEFAQDLLSSPQPAHLHEAGLRLAAAQMMDQLMRLGALTPQNAQEAQAQSEQFVRLVNSLCRLSRETLHLQKYQDTQAKAQAQAAPQATQAKPESQASKAERALAEWTKFFGHDLSVPRPGDTPVTFNGVPIAQFFNYPPGTAPQAPPAAPAQPTAPSPTPAAAPPAPATPANDPTAPEPTATAPAAAPASPASTQTESSTHSVPRREAAPLPQHPSPPAPAPATSASDTQRPETAPANSLSSTPVNPAPTEAAASTNSAHSALGTPHSPLAAPPSRPKLKGPIKRYCLNCNGCPHRDKMEYDEFLPAQCINCGSYKDCEFEELPAPAPTPPTTNTGPSMGAMVG